MPDYSSIWNTSINIANNWWSQKTGPAKLMGPTPASQSSGLLKPGLLSSLNKANPSLLGYLDILTNEVSKALSAVSSHNKFTANLNLSNTFKNALAPSPFQKSSSFTTPSATAGTFSNLATGIFKSALGAGPMTQNQKNELFTDIAAGINLGFLSATDLMSKLNTMTTQIKESLNSIQSSTQYNLGNVYSQYLSPTSLSAPALPQQLATEDCYSDGVGCFGLYLTSPPPAATSAQSAPVQTGTSAGPGGVITPPTTPVNIINNPEAQKVFESFQESSVIQFYSGTAVFIGDQTLIMQHDPTGIQHAIYGKWDESYVDGSAEIILDPQKYIDALPELEITDKSGNKHTLQSIYSGSNVAEVVVDGQTMNSDQLVEWAKDNQMTTKRSSVGATEYYADVKTLYGSEETLIAAESGSVAMNRQEYLFESRNSLSMEQDIDHGLYNPIADGVIETGSGYHEYKYNPYRSISSRVELDGKEVSADELVSWAKADGLETKSFNMMGKDVTEYYADLVTANGNKKMAVAVEVDGKADYFAVEYSNIFTFSSTNNLFEDPQGNSQQITRRGFSVSDWGPGNSGSLVEINGNIMSGQELLDWAITNKLDTREGVVNGKSVTEYLASPQQDKSTASSWNIVVAEVDGQVMNTDDYAESQDKLPGFIQMGSPIALDLDGNGVDTVSTENGVQFDLTGSGEKVQTGWVGGGDVLLALDRNNNGAIDSGKELFGNQYGAANGYEELAKFDDNKDNVINEQDAVFSRLQVWQDKNMNGVSEAGELRSLGEAGIKSLSVDFDPTDEKNNGNEIRQRSKFTRNDDSEGNTADVWFRYSSIGKYINP